MSMWGLLSKIFIVVIIVLAFPTGLILASQGASPGDSTYPIKRGMEGILSSILSLNPTTRAMFKTDLSNRRFEEAVVLLKRNSVDETATNTSLVEMLSTTAIASADIKKVTDPELKKKLTDDLSKQITNYRKELLIVAKEKNQAPTTNLSPTPIPTSVPTVIPTEKLVPTVQPGQPTFTPTPTPTITQISLTPTPSPVPVDVCNYTTKNYSQCAGTHLLMIKETTNACTKLVSKETVNDWDLKTECDPGIIGQCSATNLPACDDMLAELQKRLLASIGSINQNQVTTPTATPTSTPRPTSTPTSTPTPRPTRTPTSTPTPDSSPRGQAKQSAGSGNDETLSGSSSTTSSSPDSTSSGKEAGSTENGVVQGISTSINNSCLQNLINLFRSLISIFK